MPDSSLKCVEFAVALDNGTFWVSHQQVYVVCTGIATKQDKQAKAVQTQLLADAQKTFNKAEARLQQPHAGTSQAEALQASLKFLRSQFQDLQQLIDEPVDKLTEVCTGTSIYGKGFDLCCIVNFTAIDQVMQEHSLFESTQAMKCMS